MKIVGVIPSRYASTRFPAKPLAPILGRPLLEWVVRGAQKSQKLDELIVATDHSEIFRLAEALGVKALMTDSKLPSGTDRVWAAVKDLSADIVLNIQGDEPLIQGEVLDQLIEPFIEDETLEMATLANRLAIEDLDNPNVVKVVCNLKSDALYFSRYPIPFSRLNFKAVPTGAAKHIGIYAFRKSFLENFCANAPVELELAESLEQLRALYLGGRIRVVMTEHASHGLDRPEDVEIIESLLKKAESYVD